LSRLKFVRIVVKISKIQTISIGLVVRIIHNSVVKCGGVAVKRLRKLLVANSLCILPRVKRMKNNLMTTFCSK